MIRSRVSIGRSASLAMLAGLVLTACANSRGGPIAYNKSDFGIPDPAKAAVLPENYSIASGDKLQITVFQNEDLSKQYDVDLAGNVAMPLIGTIPAVGSTTAQLQQVIADRLKQRYMRSPDVTVSVVESTARNITIDGSVVKAGAYPVRGPMTLIEAVALANGPDQNANPRRVAIFRRIEGQRMAAAFDLVSIRRGEAEDPPVYAGDVVVVDGNVSRSMFRDLFGVLPVLALFRPY